MDVRITPAKLSGSVRIPGSKSAAHRAIIAASLAKGTSLLTNVTMSKDIEATMGAMTALGAQFTVEGDTVRVTGSGGKAAGCPGVSMNDISVYDYSTPVHRVLLEPNLLLGIGIMPAMLILVLTIVLMNVVSIWCVTIGVILYVAAKMVCKNDPYALTVIFDRLMAPDIWRAD